MKRTVLLVILASTCLISSLAFLLILKHKATLEDQYYMAYVSSGSMEPALKVGDYVVVDKNVNPAQLIAGFEYATIPGDIIAFYKPGHLETPKISLRIEL